MTCLNKKVLVGAGLVAAALLLATSGRGAGLLPFLMLMVCPLSMVFMMRAGGGHGSAAAGRDEASEPAPGTAGVQERIASLRAEPRSLEESEAPAAGAGDRLAAQPGRPGKLRHDRKARTPLPSPLSSPKPRGPRLQVTTSAVTSPGVLAGRRLGYLQREGESTSDTQDGASSGGAHPVGPVGIRVCFASPEEGSLTSGDAGIPDGAREHASGGTTARATWAGTS